MKQVLQQAELLSATIYQRLRKMLKPIFPSSQYRPGILEMTHHFKKALEEFPSSYCVIDGIDAMIEQEIDLLFDIIPRILDSRLDSAKRHKVAIFCRSSLGRGIRLQRLPLSLCVQFDIHNLREDLQLFINHGVDYRQKMRFITHDLRLIETSKESLMQHCAKM